MAVFVYRFPVPSETFVNMQIAGLTRRGVIVDVVAQTQESDSAELARELGVREVRFTPPFPQGKAAKILDAFSVAAQVGRNCPRVLLRSLNVFRLGRAAATRRLRYGAVPFLGHHYDVIHSHFGPAGLHAAMLREIGAIDGRLSTVFHGWDVSKAIERSGNSFYDMLFRYGDLFLPVSDHWRERLIELGADPTRTQVHRMGVTVPPLPLNTPPRSGPLRFLSVCRLVEKKGIEYAVRALASLKISEPWEYHIVGEGPESNRLEQLVSELGLNDHVHFDGWRTPEEVTQALESADVFLAPSVTAQNKDQEGIPVGLMEAMVRKLPVIATFHSGIPELVEDGVTGLLAPERDVESLGRHIFALASNPDLRRRLGEAGRQRVAKDYDIEKLNDALFQKFTLLAGAEHPIAV